MLLRAGEAGQEAPQARLGNSNHKIETYSFAVKRVAWAVRLEHACLHGVLYATAPPPGCKCVSVVTAERDLEHALFILALHHELRCIIAAPFH